MGTYTPNGQVWMPGTGDTAELNTLLATLASSIESGIVPRLAHQEIAVGLKAGFTSTPALTSTMTTANVSITGNNGSFQQGITISGGIATVATAGMYLISGALGIQNVGSHTAKIDLMKNATVLCSDEQLSSNTFYQVAKCTTVVNCVAGDTLSMKIGDAVNGGASVAANLTLTHFTIALVQALPL